MKDEFSRKKENFNRSYHKQEIKITIDKICWLFTISRKGDFFKR